MHYTRWYTRRVKPWICFLVEKRIVAHRAKKCATLCSTQMFVTTTVRTGHWSLFLATCCSLLSLKYSLQLNVFWLMFCLFIISTTHATCPARLAVCLVNLTMCDAVHKLWSFCLRHFFRPPAASCLTVSKVPPALVLKDPEYLLFFQCKSSSFTCA